MSFDIITLLLIMGIVVGFVSGLLGIGGGIIIMPSLFFIYSHFGIYNGQQPIYCAINTSIFIVFISGSSILVGALDGRALPLTSIPSFL